MSQIMAEKVGEAIRLTFSFDAGTVRDIKTVPGRRFLPPERGGPAWLVPLDLATARRLRQLFGDQLLLGRDLVTWGRDAVSQEQSLASMVLSDDAVLVNMPGLLPGLDAFIRGETTGWPDRPYQRADIKFMAATSAINGNQPRLGKTLEVIGAVYEAGIHEGPHLVIAPQTSLETVWRYELERWQRMPVFTYSGETPQNVRADMPDSIAEAMAVMRGYWLVTTPHMVRQNTDVFTLEAWNSVTVDEFHRTGLSNTKSQFFAAVKQLEAKRKWFLSGTPIGGKPIKLFAPLQLMYPKSFTSKWRWAEQWLRVETKQIRVKGGRQQTIREIHGLKPGSEAEFYTAHAPYMVRRLREEVLPQLPKKLPIDVWCPMTPTQAAQYRKFEEAAELVIGHVEADKGQRHLLSNCILTEYLRLKQFANAYSLVIEKEVTCKWCKDKERDDINECWYCSGTGKQMVLNLSPTEDSGKLPFLLDRLKEAGIDPDDPDGDSQAVIASQFKGTVDMIADWLPKQGIDCLKLTGDTNKRGERAEIQHTFQSGDGPRVIVMTTTAGGVAIDLGRADTCHVMDETWNPDDQEQLTDRILGAYKLHQVSCFYYRSLNTVEEYIAGVTALKSNLNDIVLDVHRQIAHRNKPRARA